MRTFPAVILASLTSIAAAEPRASAPARPGGYELGARVGGYGFRREGDPRPGEGWTQCPMNGFGVFADRALGGPLFVEAGLDMYTSAELANPQDLPIDRTSGLLTAAIGARTQITSWLRGYVQLGGGVELTRVSVPYGEERIRDSKAMPEGFFGLGIDVRVARATHVGAALRTHVMGNFDYDPARLDMNQGWVAAPAASDVFDASPGVAAQGQFYLRREL